MSAVEELFVVAYLEAHQNSSWTKRLKQCLWNLLTTKKVHSERFPKTKFSHENSGSCLLWALLSLRHSGSLLLLSYGMPLLEKQFDANPLFSVWKKDQQPFVCLILNYSPLNQGSVSITVFSHIPNPFSFTKNRFTNNPKYFSSGLLVLLSWFTRACIP